ncbi:ParB/RepB/Spo0J family partition protein [Pandoraea cepalis]|nr:ParB N-terminal domain-containing protein [Pandoraea cepalis]
MVQGQLSSAEAKIKELEQQIAAQSGAEIALDRLVEVDGRRRKLTAEQYAELKANLSAHDLATPVLVRPLADGKYELVGGYNRVAIFRELGRVTIAATIIKAEEPEKVELAALLSNLLAPSLPDFEKYEQFGRLESLTGLSRSQIASSVGLSSSHTHRIFSFEDLPEAAKKSLRVNPHRLGSAAAEKLAKLTREGRSEQVVEAINKLVEDESFTQEQAVSMATERKKAPAANNKFPTVINVGRKKFCEISSRAGVIGIRFHKDAVDQAADWEAKITAFIQAQLKDQGTSD